jgi:hypothetical protein
MSSKRIVQGIIAIFVLALPAVYSDEGKAFAWIGVDNIVNDIRYSIAYDEGRFTVCGGFGSTNYSTDGGVTWNTGGKPWDDTELLQTKGFDFNKSSVFDLACNGNDYVVCGGMGRIVWSDDGGKTWTSVDASAIFGSGGASSTSNSSSAISSIAYGGDRFIAAASKDKIAWSSNGGETWTGVDASAFFDSDHYAEPITGIAYREGRFVAVGGYNGKIAYAVYP